MIGGDPDHPPRNRRASGLDVLVVEIEHADGILRTDPNGLMRTMMGEPSALLYLEPIPEMGSVVGQGPSVLYRSLDLEVPVTPWECLGLVSYDLSPAEFLAIRAAFGDAYEWHRDFYDPDIGEALQPMGVRETVRHVAESLGMAAPGHGGPTR